MAIEAQAIKIGCDKNNIEEMNNKTFFIFE